MWFWCEFLHGFTAFYVTSKGVSISIIFSYTDFIYVCCEEVYPISTVQILCLSIPQSTPSISIDIEMIQLFDRRKEPRWESKLCHIHMKHSIAVPWNGYVMELAFIYDYNIVEYTQTCHNVIVLPTENSVFVYNRVGLLETCSVSLDVLSVRLCVCVCIFICSMDGACALPVYHNVCITQQHYLSHCCIYMTMMTFDSLHCHWMIQQMVNAQIILFSYTTKCM